MRKKANVDNFSVWLLLHVDFQKKKEQISGLARKKRDISAR